jgi:site-specific DNA-cytosine methylase
MKYRVLGISAGMGVSLFPFKENLVANVEPRSIFHTRGDIQWVNNFGKIPIYKKPLTDEQRNELTRKPIDVIIGSPDCGSGSILRFSRSKELGDHKKNVSLLLFLGTIKYYKPKVFYFENLE